MTDSLLVLIHGAGTGGWVWERTRQHLKTPALALDLPSRVPGATPESCADAVIAALEREGAGQVVPVLHSIAGVLAPRLAARLGPRLQRLIFISAIVPSAGAAAIHTVGMLNGLILRVLFWTHPAGLRPSNAMLRKSYGNDLDDAAAAELLAKYAPEFPGMYLTPVDAVPPGICATYIELSSDRSFPPRRQRQMIARLPAPTLRALDAGHMPMLSQPLALAKMLDAEAIS